MNPQTAKYFERFHEQAMTAKTEQLDHHARNLAAALAWPLVMFLPESRLRCISRVHWAGWSAYVLFRHPR